MFQLQVKRVVIVGVVLSQLIAIWANYESACDLIEIRRMAHYGRFGSNLCNWLHGMIVSSGSCAPAPVITTQ